MKELKVYHICSTPADDHGYDDHDDDEDGAADGGRRDAPDVEAPRGAGSARAVGVVATRVVSVTRQAGVNTPIVVTVNLIRPTAL